LIVFSINSDGQQFHIYQQNEQSLLTYDVRNPGPGLGQTQTYGGVKPAKVV